MFVSTLNDSNNGKVNNSSYFFTKKRWCVSQQTILLAPYDLHTYGKLL